MGRRKRNRRHVETRVALNVKINAADGSVMEYAGRPNPVVLAYLYAQMNGMEPVSLGPPGQPVEGLPSLPGIPGAFE
jgi:hypothetical protein